MELVGEGEGCCVGRVEAQMILVAGPCEAGLAPLVPDTSRFFEDIDFFYLYQHAYFPPRFREGRCHSRLDLVFGSEELTVEATTEPLVK